MNTKEVERINKEVWMNSHLSLARFSGAVTINGVKYILHPVSEQLVREDIYKAETKSAKKKPVKPLNVKQLNVKQLSIC